jgi:hypothetical protein
MSLESRSLLKSPDFGVTSPANATRLLPPSGEWTASAAALNSKIRHLTAASFDPSVVLRGSALSWKSRVFIVTSPGCTRNLFLRSALFLTTAPPPVRDADLPLTTDSAAPADGRRLFSPAMIGVIVGVFVLALAIAALFFVARLRKARAYSYDCSGDTTEAATESVPSLAQAVELCTGVNMLSVTDIALDSLNFRFDGDEDFFH